MLGRLCPWGHTRQEGWALITPLPFSRDTVVLANTSKVGTRAGVGDKESGIPKPVSCRWGKGTPCLFLGTLPPLEPVCPSACSDGYRAGHCPSGVGSKGLGCKLQQGTLG